MWVSALELTDFRNYHRCLVEFGPGVSVLLGSNGQGKTNLVEAIGYAATFGSHRVAQDAALIRRGATTAGIRVEVRRGDRRARLDIAMHAGRANRVQLNGAALPRTRDAVGLLRAVVFAPEDLALVRGEPADRRRFLDLLLIQRYPRYAGVRADLDRVLRQRNALLKSMAGYRRPDDSDLHTLEIWTEQLVVLGEELIAGRRALLADLATLIAECHAGVAGSSAGIEAAYVSAAEPHGGLAAAFQQRRDEEIRRGLTLVGPQRDDVRLLLDDEPARGYASHGESWSIALALRLASYRLLAAESIHDGDPILILDDVFAELDERRRRGLVDQVGAPEQVLITAAVADDVPPSLAGPRFAVEDGRVDRVAP